jgi:hypothetical protein
MDWLDPPYNYPEPQEGVPFVVRVIRYQVGLSERPIPDPPGSAVRTTIRFHIPPEDNPAGPPYLDFTNQGLITRILDIYDDLIDSHMKRLGPGSLKVLEATSPKRSRPLPLRLTRRGQRLDTMYEVEVLEV